MGDAEESEQLDVGLTDEELDETLDILKELREKGLDPDDDDEDEDG